MSEEEGVGGQTETEADPRPSAGKPRGGWSQPGLCASSADDGALSSTASPWAGGRAGGALRTTLEPRIAAAYSVQGGRELLLQLLLVRPHAGSGARALNREWRFRSLLRRRHCVGRGGLVKARKSNAWRRLEDHRGGL